MARARRPARTKRPKVAKTRKQPVIVAVKVPASPTSTTGPAKKLLAAIGERPKPARKRKSR